MAYLLITRTFGPVIWSYLAVMPQLSVVRNCFFHFQIDDTNHTGKYFEVRYFLNVVVCSTHTLVYGLNATYISTDLVQKIGYCSVADCSHSYG